MLEYLDELNDEQFDAVTNPANKILVMAGAGSGKTKVLTTRIRYLLDKGVNSNKITAITFTKKARDEMVYRLKDYNFERIYTFHSYSYLHLKNRYEKLGFTNKIKLIDDDYKLKLLEEILKDNKIDIAAKQFLDYISKRKNGIETLGLNTEEQALFNKIYYLFQDKLHKYNYIDFDDMVPLFLNNIDNFDDKDDIYEENEYILVDECQDINMVQYKLLLKLSSKYKNLFLVGDENQLIYSFRSSDISILNDFKDSCDKLIILNKNYRSSQNILTVANNLIKHNTRRMDIDLKSHLGNLYNVKYQEFENTIDEANRVAEYLEHIHNEENIEYTDMAILYRNNYQASQLELALEKRKMPFTIYGKKPFYRYPEIKRIIYLFRLLEDNNDLIAFTECILQEHYIKQDFKAKYENQSLSLFEFASNYPNQKYQNLVKNINEINIRKDLISTKQLFNLILQLIYDNQFTKYEYERIYLFRDLLCTADNDDKSLLIEELIIDNDSENRTKGINLMTIHKSKGLEFKVVVIISLNEGIIPGKVNTVDQYDEERRICYVAMTRAKERLLLTSSRQHFINGKRKILRPSPFIKECKNEL